MNFSEPWVFYLLWSVPVFAVLLWWLWRRGRDRLALLLDDTMRRKLCPMESRRRFYLQFACVTLGLLLTLLAAAGPRWGYREERVLQRGRDLVVALDVSRSMLARDVAPDRLRRAQADVTDLLRVLQGDRVGLLAFRGRAVLLCPLTTDYNYLESALAEISVDSAPPGETDLAAAIDQALAAFGDDVGAHRAVVMISDGEDLAGRVDEAARRAAEAGVVIFTVGLGSEAGAPIPDPEEPGGYMA
ncbi:MAG: VWA domain-containing protein, partial [Lentisphaerae bacterium]|nr:VWA domain-containing protein [Lentisphaerota bacterium]